MTKQIDIKELIPLMNKGWVAMEKDGTWEWFEEKTDWYLIGAKRINLSAIFNIKPAEDWTKSLIRVKGE